MKRDIEIPHDAARIRRLLLMLACILGMTSLSGPSLAGVDCWLWPHDVFFSKATVTDVKRCLSAGANVTARTSFGETPLHWAANKDAGPAVVQALIDAGADVNARNEDGLTPLYVAVSSYAGPDVVQTLIAAGANVNTPAKNGSTPLDVAVHIYADPAVIRALRDAGAR